MLSRIVVAVIGVFISACDGGFGLRDTNIIGDKLEDMSSLTSEQGTDIRQIAVFDQTVGRIHQFDTSNLNIERSLPVQNPGDQHSVLFNPEGNYIIDFSTKHVSIYDRQGQAQHNPISFVGKPVSAAFRPSLGLVVIYDSLMSVGILKLDADGRVIAKWKGGPDLGSNRTIAAGDIDAGGKLILALSDGSLVKVDTDQVLSNQAWPTGLTGMPTGQEDIQWLAAVRGQANQVLVATKYRIFLFDTQAASVIGAVASMRGNVLKRSKGVDAHVVSGAYWSGDAPTFLYYAGPAGVMSKQLTRMPAGVTNSRLDLVANSWTLVVADTNKTTYPRPPNPDEFNRTIRQWRFSDLDSQLELPIPDNSKLVLASRSVFALMNNKLGWAYNYDLFGGPAKEKRGFNVPYIK